jgi:hypothetical protein
VNYTPGVPNELCLKFLDASSIPSALYPPKTAKIIGIFEFKGEELIAIFNEVFIFFITDYELCFMSCDLDF